MATITERHNDPPLWAVALLLEVLAACDRHLVVFVAGPPVELGTCDFCEPHTPRENAVVAVSGPNRLGHRIAQNACRACIAVALVTSTEDGWDVTVTLPAQMALVTA